MSQAEAAPATVPAGRNPLWTLGILRSEFATTLRRWRTVALLGVLAAVPVLIGIAVRIETADGSSAGAG
ncbi:ABC transporter permease, partial [Streptomyces drozdowiczii]|nr:ABC transporter permease [Streptomyces drozdowiczii]